MTFIKNTYFIWSLFFLLSADAQQIEVTTYTPENPFFITFKITDNNVVQKIDKEVEDSNVSNIMRAAVSSDPLLIFRNEEGSAYRVLSIRIDKSFELVEFVETNGIIELKRTGTRIFYEIKPDGYIGKIRDFWVSLQSPVP